MTLSGSIHCAVVVGVGASRGIGAAVCRRIAREGLLVHVVGRTYSKLQQVVREIVQAGGRAEAHALDAVDSQAMAALFSDIARQGQVVELVVNNVGSNMPSPFLSTSPEFFDGMWRMTFLSGFIVSQNALSAMLPRQRGTLIFTGASGSLRGKPYFAAFTTGKSGLRAYSQALATEFRPQGIHVAHVVIDGIVDGDRVNHFGFGLGRVLKLAMKGLDGGLNVDAIADTYWALHRQPADLWAWEVDLRPYKESF